MADIRQLLARNYYNNELHTHSNKHGTGAYFQISSYMYNNGLHTSTIRALDYRNYNNGLYTSMVTGF